MNGCEDQQELLMLYADRELDPERAGALERHMKSCPGCSEFIARQRALEAQLKAPLSMDSTDDFVAGIRTRIQRKPHTRRLWTLAAASAAVILLIAGYYALRLDTLKELPETPLQVNDQARITARQELAAMLAGLADVPDSELMDRYTERTNPLREERWRVENMVAGMLKHHDAATRRGAIRIAGQSERFKTIPVVTGTLIRLLKDGLHPQESMTTLASLGGRRAQDALVRMLYDPDWRDEALAHLIDLEGEPRAREVTRALLEDESFPESTFTGAGVKALAQMGPEGVKGILDLYMAGDGHPALLHELNSADAGWREDLVSLLDDLHGSSLRAGLMLAASLRMEDVLEYLHPRRGNMSLNKEIPTMVALVGGAEAVTYCVVTYSGPVSLSDRKRVARALNDVFALRPDEMAPSLEGSLDSLGEGEGEVLVEMLSVSGEEGACRALSWLVKNRGDLASMAALGLARTGSDQALALLLEMLKHNGLSDQAELAAGAAAYHLGGKGVLGELNRKEASELAIKARRSSLTESRFEKLKKYMATQPKP